MGVHQPLPQSCNNLKTHLPLTFQLCGADSMKHASLSLRLVGRWGWKILVPIGHWTPCPHHFTLHLLNIVCWRLPISPPTNFCYIYDDWKPTWGISFLLLFLFYFFIFCGHVESAKIVQKNGVNKLNPWQNLWYLSDFQLLHSKGLPIWLSIFNSWYWEPCGLLEYMPLRPFHQIKIIIIFFKSLSLIIIQNLFSKQPYKLMMLQHAMSQTGDKRDLISLFYWIMHFH